MSEPIYENTLLDELNQAKVDRDNLERQLSDEQAAREDITRKYHDLAVKNKQELEQITTIARMNSEYARAYELERDQWKACAQEIGQALCCANNSFFGSVGGQKQIDSALAAFDKLNA